MADRPMETEGSDDPALAVAARHALHDEELIAAFATDAESVDDAERARSLIERCAACRDLHDDLTAIGGVLRGLEKAETVAASQRAPRDFRLSFETANELRPGSVVLRFRERLAASVRSFSRPVGLSMASLGIVGLLLGTLTLGGFASLGAAPQDNGGTFASAEATAGAVEVSGAAGTGGPRSSARASLDTQETAAPTTLDIAPGYGPGAGGGVATSTLLVGASVLLLVAGVALLLLGSRRREPVLDR